MPQLIKGKVMVTRSPCLHPGDIRVLKCVEPPTPKFEQYFNVVVFSSKGHRPQADLMSGGDLDGDEFFVCWDNNFVD